MEAVSAFRVQHGHAIAALRGGLRGHRDIRLFVAKLVDAGEGRLSPRLEATDAGASSPTGVATGSSSADCAAALANLRVE